MSEQPTTTIPTTNTTTTTTTDNSSPTEHHVVISSNATTDKTGSNAIEVVVEHGPPKSGGGAAGAGAGGHDEHGGEGDGEPTDEELHLSSGLTSQQVEELLLKWGRNEIIEKHVPSWLIFLRGLYGPMPIAIWIAVIVEFILANYPDGGILLGILFANATISWYETMKAGNAVAALKKSLRPTATVFRDGRWQNIEGTLVVPGDMVLLGSGSAVPADCILHHSELEIDESALTGESLPVTMHKGHRPKMGSNVVRGEAHATVEFTGMNTFFGRTAALLQSVQPEAEGIQRLIIRVMVVLTSLSFVLVLIAFLYLLFKVKAPVKDALDFAVVLIVASIPIAIEIVVTTTLATGGRELTHFKAIVTRLAAIEQLAGMNMLCSDKTGTLTLNEMKIQEECPTYLPNTNRESILVLAALAAKWREPPRDALDRMVLGAANLDECDKYKQTAYAPFDAKIKRTEASIVDSNGYEFKVTKGAPHIVLNLCANKAEIEHSVHKLIEELGATGTRCLAVAQTDRAGNWEMAGILTFLDPPRPDTKHTIEKAWANGIYVKMITGDQVIIAKEMARRLGLGVNIQNADWLPHYDPEQEMPKDLGEKYGAQVLAADGFAQVFPEHKFMIVEIFRQYGFTCGMTGDGVNDAPALKRADVGIAVSGATDAARAAADIVLTEPGLSVIIEAIVISRTVFNRIKSFLIYRIAATLQLLVFFFIAVFAFEPTNYSHYGATDGPGDPVDWPEFFSIPVLMLMLITLLNDGTLLTIGYDNVIPSKRPQKWNLPALFCVSIVLSAVACLSSLILLYGALDSHTSGGWFDRWGLPPMQYGKIVTMMYLKVSVSDFMTLFSSRAVESFFFESMPATVLLIGATIALALSSILASEWPDGNTSGIPTMGLAHGSYKLWPLWVWIYCIGWWGAQDICKYFTYKVLIKYDLFQYRSKGTHLNFENRFEQPSQSGLATTSTARPTDDHLISNLETVAHQHHLATTSKAATNGHASTTKAPTTTDAIATNGNGHMESYV